MLNKIRLKNPHAPSPTWLSKNKRRLTIAGPYAVCNGGVMYQYQAMIPTPAGYAQGRNAARYTNGRPGNGWYSTSAMAIPTASFSTAVTLMYPTVFAAACQNPGLRRN